MKMKKWILIAMIIHPLSFSAYATAANKVSDDPFFNDGGVLDKAREGSAYHQEFIGYNYMTGVYVKRNIDRAEYWLSKAAKKSTYAKVLLGDLYANYRGDVKQGVKWYELAATGDDADSAEAKCSYATFMMSSKAYASYVGGSRKSDMPKINALVMKAALGGAPHCSFLHAVNLSISGDEISAFSFMERAAKRCHANAQAVLAEDYLFGRGTVRDVKKAYIWYSVAYALGSSLQKNRHNLDKIISDGLLSPGDKDEADKATSEMISACKSSM